MTTSSHQFEPWGCRERISGGKLPADPALSAQIEPFLAVNDMATVTVDVVDAARVTREPRRLTFAFRKVTRAWSS
jgi:hypothetical protein